MDIEWQLTEVENFWVTLLLYDCCQILIEFKSQSDHPPTPWHEEEKHFFIVLWAHTLFKKELFVPQAFSFHPFPTSFDTYGICYKNQILDVLFGIYILSWQIYGCYL
jgi:hypothetical protein